MKKFTYLFSLLFICGLCFMAPAFPVRADLACGTDLCPDDVSFGYENYGCEIDGSDYFCIDKEHTGAQAYCDYRPEGTSWYCRLNATFPYATDNLPPAGCKYWAKDDPAVDAASGDDPTLCEESTTDRIQGCCPGDSETPPTYNGCTWGPEVAELTCEAATGGSVWGLHARYYDNLNGLDLRAQGLYPNVISFNSTSEYFHGYSENTGNNVYVDHDEIQLMPGVCPNWLYLVISARLG